MILRDRIGARLEVIVAYFLRVFFGKRIAALIVKSKQGLYAVDLEDQGVGRRLLWSGGYGHRELSRLLPKLREDDRVLILGTHIGSVAIPIAQHVKELVGFEANPNTYQLLSVNLLLNKVENCRVYNLAVSDKKETLSFMLSRHSSGGSKRVPAKHMAEYELDKPQVVSVDAVALDQYLPGEAFDVILMDIEGSEYFALKGMTSILQKARLLQIEFLPHHLEYVSNISVEDFVSVIEPHFDSLFIPSKNINVPKSHFLTTLKGLYDRDEGDEALLFSKN